MNATIAGVSANLATNYYTRVQTDAGIATAVGGVATTLSGQIAANTAAISDETGFRVAADGVIAGRVGRIEARADAGAVVSNGSFATGDFTGWNGVAVPGEFTVIAKGGTGAQASCPMPFMLKVAFNAAYWKDVVTWSPSLAGKRSLPSVRSEALDAIFSMKGIGPVSYTHLTLPTN